MDEHILQILKANKIAKETLKENEHSSDLNKSHFEDLKISIDSALNELFASEEHKILKESQKYYNSLKPLSDKNYNEREQDLIERFADATDKWESTLIEKVTSINGN